MFLGSSFKSISIHAPTRGATISRYRIMAKLKLFQSTLLQEERLRGFQSCYLSVRISIHAPTRGATYLFCTCSKRLLFQSTLLQEERPVTAAMSAKLGDISIHAPTRGATLLMGCMLMILLISIHAPTRGATAKMHNNPYTYL